MRRGGPSYPIFCCDTGTPGRTASLLELHANPPGLVAILKNDARAAILESVASSVPELRSSVPEALFGGDIGQIWEWEGGATVLFFLVTPVWKILPKSVVPP